MSAAIMSTVESARSDFITETAAGPPAPVISTRTGRVGSGQDMCGLALPVPGRGERSGAPAGPVRPGYRPAGGSGFLPRGQAVAGRLPCLLRRLADHLE